MFETPRMEIRRLIHAGLAFAMCALAACGETTANTALSAASVTPVGATGLTAPVGTQLPQPVEVLVLGTDQQPLGGVSVAFAVTAGGGTLSGASATTNASGIASTRWTMGPLAGTNTMTAVASGITATITAIATAGRAATVIISAGDAQVAPAGSAVTVPPAVRVNDAGGNPVTGAVVTFAVQSGGGRVTNAVRLTGANGVATVGSWTLGNTVGAQTLSALVADGAVTNNPIVFTATALAGAATQVTAQSSTSQTATVATAVASLPSVRVTDANGNPVAGTSVTFSVISGGGVITGGTQTTNTQGIATVGNWVLGITAGANQVSAVAAGLPPVTFAATGVAGAATQMVIRAGNNQTVQVGRLVPVSPSVTVRDVQGNAVAGTVVTFAVATGGGSVISGRQTTDASGVADVGGWFLGLTPGANSLTASAAGVSSVTFAATGTAGSPVSMVANSPVSQAGDAGTAVASRPSVVVRDLVGNPVSGVAVTFALTAGGGTVAGSPATTDAAGIATVTSWTLGPVAGPNTVVASAAGLPSVTFQATGGAGAAANVAALPNTTPQLAIQGTNVAVRPGVKVTDALGNPVAGAAVVFAATTAGGSVSGANQVTDAAGEASVTSWTIGGLVANTLTATVTGAAIAGNPVTFTARAATVIAVTQAPAAAALGADFTITVELRDAAGAVVPLAGVPLAIAKASGPGTLVGVSPISTNASGAVVFTVRVTTTAGAHTLSITGTGLTSPTPIAITINP